MKVFIWRNEKGEIEVAFEKFPNVPETAQEFDVESLDWIMFDEALGEFRVKTQDEKLQELKSQKLSELKTYVASLLAQTDWVIIKLQSMKEESWSDNEIQVEVQKYQPILEKRKRIREWNKQTEQAIQNAKTFEDINSIEIKFTT